MARLLLVDDEPLVLDVQQQLLQRKCPEWETECASGGAEALDRLENSDFDVVIADMRMPGMDGAALLARVRDTSPRTVRIIQSGHSDRESAMRAVTAAHIFIAKPTHISVLQEMLARVTTLQDLIQNPRLEEVVGGVRALPSVPRVYLELTECIAGENTSIGEIADILRSDMAMCAKVLQVARSAYFGLPRETTDISEAVSWLGISLIKSLVLASGVFEAFRQAARVPGFSIEMEQRHALRVSHASGVIAGGSGDRDDAVMAGMLHDVGRLIFASRLPDTMQQLIGRTQSEGARLHELEREEFGVTHAEVGAYLLGLWGLPYAVVEAVAHHHEPSRVRSVQLDTVAAVHIANALARAGEPSAAGAQTPTHGLIDTEFVERIGVSDRLAEWHNQLRGIGDDTDPLY
jgi:HD-like signal output (HDOD) protein/CheY-like chemotaxis protein